MEKSTQDIWEEMRIPLQRLNHGKEYTSPPKAMIIDAILREVYGSSNQKAESQDKFVVPDNLKKFFRSMREKQQT